MSDFEYSIFEDRTYTLDYEDGQVRYKVSGAEILAQFRRNAIMDYWLGTQDLDSLDIYGD